MKIFALLTITFTTFAGMNKAAGNEPPFIDIPADSILKQVSIKLNSLKHISYQQTRELNYASENYQNISSWASYFNFETKDTILGFKWQVENNESKQVFNGTENFSLDRQAKTMTVTELPDREFFSSFSPFYNSIITLRNAIPLIVADKKIIRRLGDTMIGDVRCHLITLLS